MWIGLRGGVPSRRYVNLFTILHTISSNGRPSSLAPGPLERSGPLDGGPWAMTFRPYEVIARVQASGLDELSRLVVARIKPWAAPEPYGARP